MSSPTSRKLIAVVGCHRSGTSAVTGCVRHLGVSLGGGLLLKGNKSNPLGHFENDDIVWAHRMFLGSLGAKWHRPVLPEGWKDSPEFEDIVDALSLLLMRDYEDPLCVVKDPRMTTLYPVWAEAAKRARVELVAILVERNGRDIIRSLIQREASKTIQVGMNPTRAKELIELARRGMKEWEVVPHSRITFPEELTDMETWRRVGAEIGVQWPVPSVEAEGRIRAFVTPELIHTTSSAA